MSSAQGGGSKVMQFGKSRREARDEGDAAGHLRRTSPAPTRPSRSCEEIKDFLKDPSKFQAVGARIPKGVLLYGPPGTGKTLLARAVAGEAGVPFYSISGSDFVEMFVGVGASRVRDLFNQAKENSPAIIFIDEIDAVGRHRGAGMGGGHDEREQTLNQMLVEMDGFDPKVNVIVIAATNRPDILDPALLRPGRFDRQIGVDAPDLKGRTKILEVHGRGKPLADGVDLEVARPQDARLHRRRPRQRAERGRAAHRALERAADRQPRARRGHRPRDRRSAAPHPRDEGQGEAHHGVPRGRPRARGGGDELHRPGRRRSRSCRAARRSATRWCCRWTTSTRSPATSCRTSSTYAMGGRVAEEIVFHDPTTGASNDIEKATSIARKMVTEYGMTGDVGPVKLGQSSGEVFMGRDMGHGRDFSERIAERVDAQVRDLIEQAHNEAYEVINANRDVLDKLALELLEKETLDHLELAEIFKDVKRLPAAPAVAVERAAPAVGAACRSTCPQRRDEAGLAASVEAEQPAAEKAPKRRPTGQARPATRVGSARGRRP